MKPSTILFALLLLFLLLMSAPLSASTITRFDLFKTRVLCGDALGQAPPANIFMRMMIDHLKNVLDQQKTVKNFENIKVPLKMLIESFYATASGGDISEAEWTELVVVLIQSERDLSIEPVEKEKIIYEIARLINDKFPNRAKASHPHLFSIQIITKSIEQAFQELKIDLQSSEIEEQLNIQLASIKVKSFEAVQALTLIDNFYKALEKILEAEELHTVDLENLFHSFSERAFFNSMLRASGEYNEYYLNALKKILFVYFTRSITGNYVPLTSLQRQYVFDFSNLVKKLVKMMPCEMYNSEAVVELKNYITTEVIRIVQSRHDEAMLSDHNASIQQLKQDEWDLVNDQALHVFDVVKDKTILDY